MFEFRNLDFDKLDLLIQEGDISALRAFADENQLEIINDKIYPKNKSDCEYSVKYWDKKQMVKKIGLNALYGAILNPGCRFADKRIGQSTTLTGRCIARHMHSYINECIVGEYNHEGAAIVYGDSVTGDTMIRTDDGQLTIAELYNQCLQHERNGDKEYGLQSFAKVVGFNSFEDSPIMANIAYVMRHKTKKKLYKITLQNDKTVTVTEDHSIMVDRDGFLLEIKPTEILTTDLIICLNT